MRNTGFPPHGKPVFGFSPRKSTAANVHAAKKYRRKMKNKQQITPLKQKYTVFNRKYIHYTFCISYLFKENRKA
jgi:hypothetical protein